MNKQEALEQIEQQKEAILQMQSWAFYGYIEGLVKQLDEPQPIKLKNVIARIENLDLGTKAVWINEILFKLGSDYGYHKYCAGYKQGKFDGAMEREKVTVPQFVADFITEQKKLGHTLSYSIDACMSDRVAEWYWDNSELFVQAWIFVYEVEKEKRYEVILSNGQSLKTVYRQGKDRLDFEKVYGDLERFTRKQLEDAGLAWVFDCPGVKVKEVEG